MGKPRDSQRSKVYRAETRAWQRINGQNTEFDTIVEVREWVDRIIASCWRKKLYPHITRVMVGDGRGRQHAAGNPWRRKIWMPRWSRSKLVILHELCHVFIPPHLPWHGCDFARAELEAVRRWIGPKAKRILREEFKRERVRYVVRSK